MSKIIGIGDKDIIVIKISLSLAKSLGARSDIERISLFPFEATGVTSVFEQAARVARTANTNISFFMINTN